MFILIFTLAFVTNTTSNLISTSTVFIKEDRIGVKLKVYPIPSSGILNFELSNNFSTVDVSILNALGQEILHKETKAERFSLEIDGSDGLYFVRIICGGSVYVVKVIKG